MCAARMLEKEGGCLERRGLWSDERAGPSNHKSAEYLTGLPMSAFNHAPAIALIQLQLREGPGTDIDAPNDSVDMDL
jgi:hypothetical protein